MRIVPEIGSVVGPVTSTQWGQVLITPGAYGAVEVEDPRGEAMQRGIEVLTTITSLLTTPPDNLEKLSRVVAAVEDGGICTILLCVPVGGVVHIVLRGSGRVYLKRREKIALLMDTPGGISGEVKEGDTLLFATRRFSTTLTSDEVARVFDHLSAVEAAEKLTLLLHTRDGSAGGAAMIFQVKHYENSEAFVETPVVTTLAQPTSFQSTRKRKTFSLQDIQRMVTNVTRLSPRVMWGVISSMPKRKIIMSTVVGITVIVFISSVLLGILKQRSQKDNEKASSAIAQAQHAYEEGSALLDLNPVKGRERLKEAAALIQPLVNTLSPKSPQGRVVAELTASIRDRLTIALKIVKAEPQVFYDAGLLKNNATLADIALYENSMALLDASSATLFILDITTKNGQIAGGGSELRGASLVSIHGDSVYLLTEGGISVVRILDKKVSPAVVAKNSQWGTIGDLVAFGGNFYLLDTGKSRIWKYVATDKGLPAGRQGFSELREYLNPDTLPDFAKATGLAIDGIVWVGTSDGTIHRFVQGKEETFVPQGIEPVLGNTLTVFTNDEVKHLYILDSDNKRVVALDKDGVYAAQYVWEGQLKPTKLVVSEMQKKLLLLADGKLYSLELK